MNGVSSPFNVDTPSIIKQRWDFFIQKQNENPEFWIEGMYLELNKLLSIENSKEVVECTSLELKTTKSRIIEVVLPAVFEKNLISLGGLNYQEIANLKKLAHYRTRKYGPRTYPLSSLDISILKKIANIERPEWLCHSTRIDKFSDVLISKKISSSRDQAKKTGILKGLGSSLWTYMEPSCYEKEIVSVVGRWGEVSFVFSGDLLFEPEFEYYLNYGWNYGQFIPYNTSPKEFLKEWTMDNAIKKCKSTEILFKGSVEFYPGTTAHKYLKGIIVVYPIETLDPINKESYLKWKNRIIPFLHAKVTKKVLFVDDFSRKKEMVSKFLKESEL